MNRKLPHLLTLISLGIILGAGAGIFLETPQVIAGETKQNQEAEKQAIKAVIEKFIRASNAEDIQGIQNTYHPNSSEFNQQQRAGLEQLFKEYDIKFEIIKLDYIKIANNEATVKVATKGNVRGYPNSKDNKVSFIANLQKYQGRWKIFSLQVEE